MTIIKLFVLRHRFNNLPPLNLFKRNDNDVGNRCWTTDASVGISRQHVVNATGKSKQSVSFLRASSFRRVSDSGQTIRIVWRARDIIADRSGKQRTARRARQQ